VGQGEVGWYVHPIGETLEEKLNFLQFRIEQNFLYTFLHFSDTCPEKLQDMCGKVYMEFCSIQTAGSIMCLRKCAGHSSSTALVLYQEI